MYGVNPPHVACLSLKELISVLEYYEIPLTRVEGLGNAHLYALRVTFHDIDLRLFAMLVFGIFMCF